MMYVCMKCGLELDIDKGIIMIIYPVFFKGNFLSYTFCRAHFLEADKMNNKEIGKWVQKKGAE